MKKILYITNMAKQIHHVREVEAKGRIEAKEHFKIDLYNLKQEPEWNESWEQRLKTSDVVIMKHMGTGLDTPFLRRLANWLYQNHPCYALYADEEQDMDKLRAGMSEAEMIRLSEYQQLSGLTNFENSFLYAASLAGEAVEVPEPIPVLWQGILGENGVTYATYKEYLEAEGVVDCPSIGVFFYREEWIMKELYYPELLRKTIKTYGYNPIIFFGQYGGNPLIGAPSLKESLRILFCDGPLPFEVLINTCKFSLISLNAATQEDISHWDIPILMGYNIYMDEATWEANVQGLSPLDVNLSVSLPEFDGSLHGGVVAAQTNIDGKYIYWPVKERVESIVKRAVKYEKLRHLLPAERKVAIILHNYPPKNSNIGSAAGLDTPESVQRLLVAMKNEGYTIDLIPESGAELIESVLSHTTNDRSMLSEEQVEDAEGKLSVQQYKEFFDSLPDKSKVNMEEGWGPAPGEVFRYGDELLIPGFSNGNIWVTVQPPRGFGEDPGKLYHDPILAPTHHYEGFYYWLREIFKADVVMHVGTHGSLEWLPGKGTGLSSSCYPEMGIQDLPNVYPYWMTIVGEGIQAKRRSSACLIGHISPPMSKAGLYDEYEELENLLDEYGHFELESPESLTSLYTAIVEQAKACHFWESIPEDKMTDAESVLAYLHELLTDLKHMQMRTGLHILGKAPTGKDLQEFLLALMRVQNGIVPALPDTIAKGLGYDWNTLEQYGGQKVDSLQIGEQINSNENQDFLFTGKCILRNKDIVDQIWHVIRDVIAHLAENDYIYSDSWQHLESVNTLWQRYSVEKDSKVKQVCLTEIGSILLEACHEYVPKLKQTEQEIGHTLKALAGHYIEPGPGGAATSGRADVLPSGRNFFGVDERMLPTKVAYELGSTLADQVITDFIKEEGHYPESIGIVLWAGSNTRSHGQCLGQFMNLMGVRPIWQGGGGRVIGVEAIPLAELKRPRIDVTGRISGLIRDMMPNALKWLDKAVTLVAELDESEEDNFIKKHINEDVSWLVSEGEDEKAAYQKARFRLFGDPPGAYGAGIGQLIEQKNWESIDDLADVYVTWGSYCYGDGAKSNQDKRIFRRRLDTMEVTIKNEDNREAHMLSSDDYNAYHGGLIAAVRSIRGEVPRSYVGDSSNREQVKTRNLKEEVNRLVRGETLNPKFIEGMQQHGYKGASDLANVVAHSFAWDATSAVIEDWVYEGYANKYALDKDMQEWMQSVNPWALARIAETLLEAIQRGLWQAPKDMEDQLKQLYLAMEGEIEGR